MLAVAVDRGILRIGRGLAVSFQRSERLPGGVIADRPPSSLGVLPAHRVSDHQQAATPELRSRGGFFVPVGTGESWWLGLSGERRHYRVRLEWESNGEAAAQRHSEAVTVPPSHGLFGLICGGELHQYPSSGFARLTVIESASTVAPSPTDPSSEPRAHRAGRETGPRHRAAGARAPEWNRKSETAVPLTLVTPPEYERLTGSQLPPLPDKADRYVPHLLP